MHEQRIQCGSCQKSSPIRNERHFFNATCGASIKTHDPDVQVHVFSPFQLCVNNDHLKDKAWLFVQFFEWKMHTFFFTRTMCENPHVKVTLSNLPGGVRRLLVELCLRVHTGSLWLKKFTVCFCVQSGSQWLTMAHAGSLWLTLAHRTKILAHVRSPKRTETDFRSPLLETRRILSRWTLTAGRRESLSARITIYDHHDG